MSLKSQDRISVARLRVLIWRELISIANPSQSITRTLILYFASNNICQFITFIISQLESKMSTAQ